MATFAAVAATSSALLGLLQAAAYGHAEFGDAQFPLLRSDDLQKSLPLDLHYLMTAWAKDAGTQQRLLGWAARTVHDNPTLPAGLLNAFGPEPVFRPGETVEVVWAPSGVHALRGLPGLGAAERGTGDAVFWYHPPAAGSYRIDIRDPQGRYLLSSWLSPRELCPAG